MELRKSKCLDIARKMLKDSNINSTKDCEHILASILDVDVADLNSISQLSKSQAKKFNRAIKQRCKHVPLDKIIGYTDFINVRIPFEKSTLTPRQETEILTDMIIKDIKGKKLDVLDLCSGSGCIGLAIAKNSECNVTLSDISKKAIKISERNANINDIKVNYIISDMFANIPSKFDIIVCNPPYITRNDLEKLEIEVKDFDPRLALDGGIDGLDFYREIGKNAAEYLNDGGKIYLEIGIDQSKAIVECLTEAFVDIKVLQDYSGIDRYIIAKKR